MPFFCQQCGECCSHMGLVHRIKEEIGEFRFLVVNEYTGEATPVEVDPDKIALFEDRSIFSIFPDACPFLRRDVAGGRICCTVHLTWPEICREFSCWRILILDPSGRRSGRVMGARYLACEDEHLHSIWRRRLDELGIIDDECWDRELVNLAEKHGYRVFL